MLNKKSIVDKIKDYNEKLLISKIIDKANIAEKSYLVTNSNFLTPAEKNLIHLHLNNKGLNYCFCGGYNGAEREVLVFSPYLISEENKLDWDFLKVISISYNSKFSKELNHRDYLGALLSLGIKREKIGDILIKDNECDIIILSEILDFLVYNLKKIGKTKVDIKVKPICEIIQPVINFKDIVYTVSSLRIDAIIAGAFNFSRGVASELIKSKRVFCNYVLNENISFNASEGSYISVRGYGKFKIEEILGYTKKDRIKIRIKKYI